MLTDTRSTILGLVDDDDLFRAHLKHSLEQEGYIVMDAHDGESFLSSVQARKPDCILLDYDLGAETGFHVYERMKNTAPEAPPVIMLTANEQQPVAVKAFRSGVVDFIAKRGLRVDALRATIDKAIRHRDETQLRDEQMALLKSQYALDLATGLLARHEVEKRIVQMAKGAERRGVGFTMIFASMACVQAVSDRFGYVQGDRVLRAAASRFREAIRQSDQGGRVDDAVFVCLVDCDTTQENVDAVEASIARALSFEFRIQAASVNVEPQTRVVRCPDDGNNPLLLLKNALESFTMADETTVLGGQAFAAALVSNGEIVGSEGVPSPGSQEGAERRQSRRHRVFKGAKIVVGPSTFDCTIRDMSDGGARLRVPESFAAPAQFDLRISDSGEQRRVAVRWQVGIDLGVQFLA